MAWRTIRAGLVSAVNIVAPPLPLKKSPIDLLHVLKILVLNQAYIQVGTTHKASRSTRLSAKDVEGPFTQQVWRSSSDQSRDFGQCHLVKINSTFADYVKVGGPSRGTRFRPLSLDVPKVGNFRPPAFYSLTVSPFSLSSMLPGTRSSGTA